MRNVTFLSAICVKARLYRYAARDKIFSRVYEAPFGKKLGFSNVFSTNLSYILSNTLYGNFQYVHRTNKWFKTAENLL